MICDDISLKHISYEIILGVTIDKSFPFMNISLIPAKQLTKNSTLSVKQITI